ncbi:Glycosyltransferase [Psidium guajava]|nr:Glycosyltransferase [Psidium guajava]
MPSKKHVAVCAFPFGSHAWVLANLVGKLAAAAADVHFSFLSTAKSNSVVFPHPSRAALIPSNLRVYDVGDGLPAGYREAAGDPRDPADLFLRAASASFQAGVDTAERDAGRKVSLLLTDGLLSVVAREAAEKMHVPWVAFWASAPHSLSMHVYADLIHQLSRDAATDEGKTLDIIPGLSLMRMVDLPEELVMDPDTSTVCRMFRELGNVIPRAAAVVMNSFAEMDPEPLTADLRSKFSMLLHLGMLTLGLSSPPSLPASDETGCLTWLDSHGPQTVVYISFGSGPLSSPPQAEITSLAEALESTGTPFLWSLNDRLRSRCLPGGFEERTSGRGRMVPWAPQREVLGHPACGAFVTHCGYNSVFESMAAGVPMIGRPVAVDQRICGKMVEEVWGVGAVLERGIVTRSGMVKALEAVLRSEEGKVMREKVGELRRRLVEVAGPGGRAEADFKTLVELICAL